MDNSMLLLLLLALSGKDENLQETLKRALNFYRENRETVQMLLQMFPSQPAEPQAAPAAPAKTEPDTDETKKSRSEPDFDRTVLESFLRAQTLS